MNRRSRVLVVSMVFTAMLAPMSSAQIGQPGLIQEHWYHSYASLTLDVNEWADENDDIIRLEVAGQTELGRNLWVLQISDWSLETRPDGHPKEVVYIDGGHHGNEHLGTELAFLTAKHYIDGWNENNEYAVSVLENTELHILIMLNADGNDHDTRWNINQVDLNRNYDHYWNTCPTTQPGSSAFSEVETLANSIYMNTVVPDADLYVTMHTGVWIMLYPWGKWPNQPPDWEMFHHVRDEVNSNISDIPIRNANQGLYPNCGTSRDYGYGVMGYPTFTFETDDEQFLLGTVEALSDRLAEELEVMVYLIENVWYWRARLVINEMIVQDTEINLKISNLGHATTSNASLVYLTENGDLLWESETFSVNATTSVYLELENFTDITGSMGQWALYYQKRVIDSSQWVTEPIGDDQIKSVTTQDSLLPYPSLLLQFIVLAIAALSSNRRSSNQVFSRI